MSAGHEMLRHRALSLARLPTAGDADTASRPQALGWRYLLYASGLSMALTGGWVRRTLIGWQTWELTHSSFWIGVIGFCTLMPMLLFGPLGGAAADRHPVLRVLRTTQIMGCVQTLLLAAAAWQGLLDVPVLLAITITTAITMSFESPASNVFIRAIVSREALSRAISMNSVVGNGALLVAPGIAVFLFGRLGAAGAYAVGATAHVAFLACLCILRAPGEPSPAATSSYLDDIKSGCRYAAKDSEMRMLLVSFFVVSVGARSLTYMMPAFAAERFAASPETLGILLSALAAGAVCAGIYFGLRKGDLDAGSMVFGSVVANAICLAVAACVPGLPMATIAVFCLGVAFACNNIATQTAVQTITPQEMSGRMLSLYGIAFRTGPALGSLGLGMLAEKSGIVTAEILAAVAIGVYAGCAGFRSAGSVASAPERLRGRPSPP
jgi:MFS family permease